METAELIDLAADKVGGLRELGRRLDWNSGAIADVKRGKRPLPPYRAAQLAEIVGGDAKSAYLTALREKAESDGERKLLGELLIALKAGGRVLTLVLATYAATFLDSKPAYAESGYRNHGEYTLFIFQDCFPRREEGLALD